MHIPPPPLASVADMKYRHDYLLYDEQSLASCATVNRSRSLWTRALFSDSVSRASQKRALPPFPASFFVRRNLLREHIHTRAYQDWLRNNFANAGNNILLVGPKGTHILRSMLAKVIPVDAFSGVQIRCQGCYNPFRVRAHVNTSALLSHVRAHTLHSAHEEPPHCRFFTPRLGGGAQSEIHLVGVFGRWCRRGRRGTDGQ